MPLYKLILKKFFKEEKNLTKEIPLLANQSIKIYLWQIKIMNYFLRVRTSGEGHNKQSSEGMKG